MGLTAASGVGANFSLRLGASILRGRLLGACDSRALGACRACIECASVTLSTGRNAASAPSPPNARVGTCPMLWVVGASCLAVSQLLRRRWLAAGRGQGTARHLARLRLWCELMAPAFLSDSENQVARVRHARTGEKGVRPLVQLVAGHKWSGVRFRIPFSQSNRLHKVARAATHRLGQA